MTETRWALYLKFRAHLEARARRIFTIFSGAEDAPEVVRTDRELLGELHTLKGEARMLGLAELASLAHALEDALASPEPLDVPALGATLEAVVASLDEDTNERTAALLLQTALEALGVSVERAEELDEPPDEAEEQPRSGASDRARGRRWIQVDAAVVDELCESLATVVNDLGHQRARLAALAPESPSQRSAFRALVDDAERTKTRLEEGLLLAFQLRLTPLEPTLLELGRHVEELGRERGKQVRVTVQATGVQIERGVLTQLWDPLLHLMKNAVDHGLERPEERGDKPPLGTIEVRAETSGPFVTVRVSDDGRGVDTPAVVRRAIERDLVSADAARTLSPEAILELLFLPGFSTRDSADDVSGRGVGLEVVKRQAESWGGGVEIQSALGQGTSFVLSVPATLTKERLLVFELGEQLYALPSRVVASVESAPRDPGSTFAFRDRILPLGSLGQALSGKAPLEEKQILILKLGSRAFAALVPRVLGEFELIRRPVGHLLSRVSPVTASVFVDDGRMALVLDPRFLLGALEKTPARAAPRATERARPARRVLIADDSVVVRDLITEVLTSVGYEVKSAANGKIALGLLESYEPGLVVSDVEMPELDGFALLQAIRQRAPTLPVILLTARGSTEDRRRASSLGANAYVAKGEFKGETLIEVVSRFYPRAP